MGRRILVLKVKVFKDTRGQDLIEYAVMAGFVAVAAGAACKPHRISRHALTIRPCQIGTMAASVLAQNVARPLQVKQQLAIVNQLLERGRTSKAERLLRQLIPKPKE